jgi:peptidoglycan hydrolase CwlO-like protein
LELSSSAIGGAVKEQAMKKAVSMSFLAISLAISLIPEWKIASASAQEPGAPAQTKAQTPPGQKPAGDKATGQEQVVEGSDEALRRAISGLSEQVGELKAEVRRLRQETERSSITLEIMLYEERLAKAEAKLDAETQNLNQLDSRVQDIQRRIESVPQEVLARGILRRDEGERALRAEYQRLLDQTQEDRITQQQRVTEAQAKVARLRQQVEALSKKLEPVEEKK